jgi:FdhD protein
MIPPTTLIRYHTFAGPHAEIVENETITEQPVSLTVNGEVWLTFMCTPVDLEALAVGFLYNEGYIESAREIANVRVCPTSDNVDVWLHHTVEKPTSWRRASGCTGGITGGEEAAHLETLVYYNGDPMAPEQLTRLMTQLFEEQMLHRATGGTHITALSDGRRILAAAEDIGRHNTLDKIAGRCLLDKIRPRRRVLLSTGRISSEMLQKAARIGASMVISHSSPTSLSIELAARLGITLIGYARRGRFNVYTHPERILGAEQEAENVTHWQPDA